MKKREKLKKPINLNENLNKMIQNTDEHTRAASIEANSFARTRMSKGNSSGTSDRYKCTYQGYSSGSGCMYWRCVDNDNIGYMPIVVAYCGDGWSAWYVQ